MTQQATTVDELAFTQPYGEQEQQVLTAEAVEFLTELVTRFTPQRNKLLAARIHQQQEIDDGKLPGFISETASIRRGEWKIRGIPEDLQDRRVEITGPVERKMVINAMNANVKVFMADFEDSLAPDWRKVIEGQINLRDAVNGTISYTNEAGKIYQLKPNPAVLICRVRGLHLPEKHVTWRGEAIPGSLFDFALYFFHNHKNLLAKGSGPYFYLPKTQAWQEAAWWSEVFSYAEDRFNLPRGTIKATLLIETLPAVFQMHEILHALRDHIVGLNCGRWDYIFSYIKTLKNYPDRVLPDRQVVTMDKPFLSAYSRLLIKTCHKRGAFAMGGMAAFIPSKDTELFQPAVIDSRASRAIIRLPGRRICCPRPEHDIIDSQRCVMRASRSLTDDCLRPIPCNGKCRQGRRICHAPLRFTDDERVPFEQATHTPKRPKRLFSYFRHPVNDVLRLHAHCALDDNRILLILHNKVTSIATFSL